MGFLVSAKGMSRAGPGLEYVVSNSLLSQCLLIINFKWSTLNHYIKFIFLCQCQSSYFSKSKFMSITNNLPNQCPLHCTPHIKTIPQHFSISLHCALSTLTYQLPTLNYQLNTGCKTGVFNLSGVIR